MAPVQAQQTITGHSAASAANIPPIPAAFLQEQTLRSGIGTQTPAFPMPSLALPESDTLPELQSTAQDPLSVLPAQSLPSEQRIIADQAHAAIIEPPSADTAKASQEHAGADTSRFLKEPAERTSLSSLEKSLGRRDFAHAASVFASFYDGSAYENGRPALFAADLPLFSPPLEKTSGLLPHIDALGQADHIEASPGSVFTWRSVEDSPGHGFWPADVLLRRVLGKSVSSEEKGFTLADEDMENPASVFLYGEKHTDPGLIEKNFRALAYDLRPGRGALILDEGYFGPRLIGEQALHYLEQRGMPKGLIPATASVEVRGWDDKKALDLSLHPALQHHMNLLDLHEYLYSPERGLLYYRTLAEKLSKTWENWRLMRKLAISDRNLELDKSLRTALKDADTDGRSVHVIAGTEHLLRHPLWTRLPLIGRPSLREGLKDALKGRRYRASKPSSADAPSAALLRWQKLLDKTELSLRNRFPSLAKQFFPPIFVSGCLLAVHCRYDARPLVAVKELIRLSAKGRVAWFCPEVGGGLATPRPPANIVGGNGDDVLDGRARVMTSGGADVTEQFVSGARRALAAALAAGCRVAYMKSGSPSCDSVYGVAAALFKRAGIRVISQDSPRLSHPSSALGA